MSEQESGLVPDPIASRNSDCAICGRRIVSGERVVVDFAADDEVMKCVAAAVHEQCSIGQAEAQRG